MIRKAVLFTTAFIQYLRIRLRKREQLEQNDLAYICKLKPMVTAVNEHELMFILTSIRPIARRLAPENLCLDLSLVLLNMSSIPTKIHFSIHKRAKRFSGHAWIETESSLLSTDYDYQHDSIWSWEKPLDVL